MLLPYVLVVDVKPQTEAYIGWCYCQVADVIATARWYVVADVIASGRWKSHRVNLLQFEFWGVNQNLIPNMWQMVFAHISVEGWIIDPYVQSLFYCSSLVQVLPPNNFEIDDGNTVTTDVTVVIYGRGGFQMFIEPFSKSSWGLSNIFLITIHPVTMISVDDSTLFLDWISVFVSHQDVLDNDASLAIHLYPKLSANVLMLSLRPL